MASSRDPYSILNNDPNRGKLVPQYNPVKLERYRPGKAPSWAEESHDSEIFKTKSEAKQTLIIDHIESLPTAETHQKIVSTSRRQMLKQRALVKHKQKTHEEFPETLILEEEYEDMQEEPQETNLKPSFVSRDNRMTLKEKEQMEMDQQEILEKLRELREERKSYTKYILAEALLREEIGEASKEEELSEEEIDDANEFAL